MIKVNPEERESVRIVDQTGFTSSADHGGGRCRCAVGPSCATDRVREIFEEIKDIGQEVVEVVAQVQVPQIQETAGVFKVIPQERVSEPIVEPIVAVPQIQAHGVGVVKVTPQRVSERMGEEIVAVEHIFLPV